MANHVVVKPGTDGKVCVFTYAATHVLVDLLGWITVGRRLHRRRAGARPRHPHRQRPRSPPAARPSCTSTPSGVPAGAEAVVVNVTAVDPRGPGYLSVSPCPGARGSGVERQLRARARPWPTWP